MIDFLMEHGSYLGIMVILILTGCGLPIPEEVPILGAAMLSAHGLLNPWLAFAACLVGALIGDIVMYGIGYRWGHGLLKDHPRFAKFLHAEREATFEDMINRHGLKVLFLARFMVGVRSPVYLSAGILRIPFRRFLLMDLLCATVVVGVFFGLTFMFGEQIADWLRRAQLGTTVVIVLVVVAAAGFIYWRRRKRWQRLLELRDIRAQRATDRDSEDLGEHKRTVA